MPAQCPSCGFAHLPTERCGRDTESGLAWQPRQVIVARSAPLARPQPEPTPAKVPFDHVAWKKAYMKTYMRSYRARKKVET